MNYSVSIAEAAEADIREAFLWYQDKNDNLGLRFEKHILKAVESIRSNPFKTQIRYDSIRVFFLKKFPFGIHFRVNEATNSILILAVFHTSKDSKKWKMEK
ncbi:type II toxin-antitoxin system RelE/ParE family toxin [Fulvivirga maritima]|uniref:type II toxin-antitoxin system RelE/ParE family toxin n=1 Tax=Fulvivirga maritima TaxID=2904247 RepID=UPI001F44BDE2|nr:type II toxin-antitoxin system RelE/ParE family toxin [Fulvivirga maritima]UII28774.1 type II toxin-antitoxin system RelE/ParE family toxin [Fulvivirga maritima]